MSISCSASAGNCSVQDKYTFLNWQAGAICLLSVPVKVYALERALREEPVRELTTHPDPSKSVCCHKSDKVATRTCGRHGSAKQVLRGSPSIPQQQHTLCPFLISLFGPPAQPPPSLLPDSARWH
eukprot:1139774-Pelagomonas_calceolata.AAC.3